MAEVTGAGIALAFDDFQFAMAPTSYFEQVGAAPAGQCTSIGQTAGNYNCWRRGDMRWYGVNISAAGGSNDGYHWDDATVCSSSSLGCPRGGVIDNFSPFDNPYLIRSSSPQGMAYNGTCVNGTAGGCNTTGASTKAIYEFLAPSSQPNYTFSWWGEIEVRSTRNSTTETLATNAGTTAANVALGGGLLKSQTIIRGNAAGSVFRLFQDTQNQSFGMLYHSRLQGDFRFSLAQVDNTHDAIGIVPVFESTEGMYFNNVNAYLPLGQLYYQALTIAPVGSNGGFALSLTPLPSGTAAVYNLAYSVNAGDTTGFVTAFNNNRGLATSAAYQLTHGFVRYGGWTAAGAPIGQNAINASDDTSTGDGVSFRACAACAPFFAHARSPIRIDKRGPTQSMQLTANYKCNTGNTGGCVFPDDDAGTDTDDAYPYGPVTQSAGDITRSFPTTVVNLGDSRIEGLLFQSMKFTSCSAIVGGC